MQPQNAYNQPQGYNQAPAPYGQPQVPYNQPQVPYGQPVYGQPNMQPNMQPYGQPQMMMGPPMSNFQTLSGFDKLAGMPGIFIKQKFEVLEALTGCETENKYQVFRADSNGERTNEILFKAKEKSDCLARQCLSGDCRPFKCKVENEPSGINFLRLERECACTCLCFNRPSMEVFAVENRNDNGDFLGKITNPFTCFNRRLEVWDNKGTLRYALDANCCQLGFFCKCPCEPCQIIDFDVLDANAAIIPGARLQKRSAGCLKAAVSDADNFSLIFPPSATKEDRALLLAAVIMMDFMFFEEKPNQQQRNNNY